jgi:hypothetical protein
MAGKAHLDRMRAPPSVDCKFMIVSFNDGFDAIAGKVWRRFTTIRNLTQQQPPPRIRVPRRNRGVLPYTLSPQGNKLCARFALRLMICRRLLKLLSAVAITGCAMQSAFGSEFGVVARSQGGSPCAVFSSSAMPGERVKILVLEDDRRIDARLGSKLDVQACGVGLEPGQAYQLELAQAQARLPVIAVAVRGSLASGTTFRQCAGTESVHVTAWRRGVRIWHGYYYLGYDVKPDCKPSDIE